MVTEIYIDQPFIHEPTTVTSLGARYCLKQFITECIDKGQKVYKVMYIVDGEECIHYLCERHAQMDCFKEGLIKLESIMAS